jgi:hypothetical protein
MKDLIIALSLPRDLGNELDPLRARRVLPHGGRGATNL